MAKPRAGKFIYFPADLWGRVQIQARLDSLPPEELVILACRELLARRVQDDLKAGRLVRE